MVILNRHCNSQYFLFRWTNLVTFKSTYRVWFNCHLFVLSVLNRLFHGIIIFGPGPFFSLKRNETLQQAVKYYRKCNLTNIFKGIFKRNSSIKSSAEDETRKSSRSLALVMLMTCEVRRPSTFQNIYHSPSPNRGGSLRLRGHVRAPTAPKPVLRHASWRVRERTKPAVAVPSVSRGMSRFSHLNLSRMLTASCPKNESVGRLAQPGRGRIRPAKTENTRRKFCVHEVTRIHL